MKSGHVVRAGVLDVAYDEYGDPHGPAVVLSHGFPYDPRCFDDVRTLLGERVRTIVPYLRGFGPTRFVSDDVPRSGQQAALGADLLALLDALQIEHAVLGGFDWGGRASCIVAALHPERVTGLVTGGGYNVQDLAKADEPVDAATEHRLWYQYYLHGARGEAALAGRRDAFCRYLWTTWSPEWKFAEATFAASATSFGNDDFVPVVVHSYRHRFNLVAGDPAYAAMERELATRPRIEVPAIALYGASDGVDGPGALGHAAHFGARYEERVARATGHNLPQEAPDAFARAVLDLL